MKTIFILLLSLYTLPFFAQVEFAPEGAEWHYGTEQLTFMGDVTYGVDTYQFKKDTIINGESAKIISQHSTTQENTQHIIKQDGAKIFIYRNGLPELLYDFDAVIGDSMEVMLPHFQNTSLTLKVKQIETVTLNQKELQVITYETYFNEYQAEDLIVNNQFGALNNYPFDYRKTYVIDNLYFSNFRCYSDDAFGFYQEENAVSCDSLISSNKKINTAHSKIFPNPTSNILYLELGQNKSSIPYSVRDLTGKIVLEGRTNNQAVNVSSLYEGIYILVLFDNNKKLTNKLFIKK